MLNALINNYELTIYSMGALSLLLLIQVIVADVVGLKARHVPGTPVEGGHSNLLFRVTRTVGNTNESIAIYIITVLFCMFSGADATYVGYLSWGYVIARTAYAICYYTNQQMARSVCFGISLLSLAGLLGVGVFT